MKVLITGANGFLGNNITRYFINQGIQVRAIVRPESNLLSLKDSDAEIFKGSFLNPTDVKNALLGCQVVIHAASYTSQKLDNYKTFQTVNIDGTDQLLQLSLDAGVDRFIYVGSANAFSPGTIQNPGNEHSSFNKLQYESYYMKSKYEAQNHVIQFYKEYNFPAFVVNPTFMLGKYDSKPSSGQLLLMAYAKNVMPVPSGGKNFIHVEDVASAIFNSINRGEPGECYLLGNENLHFNTFFHKMQTVCGFPKHQFQIPSLPLKIAGLGGSLWGKLSGKHLDFNHVNTRILTTDYFYTSAKAKSKLQLPQTPIETAIKDALDWFKEIGSIKT